jgi:hypothetical protein
MALNKERALNDLERTKFKAGATSTDSIVQVCSIEPDPGATITSPLSRVIVFPVSGVEQEIVFASDVVAFDVMNQSTNTVFTASWQSGETSNNFFKINPGQTYSEKNILSPTSLSLYINSSRNGATISIVQWI